VKNCHIGLSIIVESAICNPEKVMYINASTIDMKGAKIGWLKL
jgi:hypothetical protein